MDHRLQPVLELVAAYNQSRNDSIGMRLAVREYQDGEILAVFPSQCSLARFTGVSRSQIGFACNRTFHPNSTNDIQLERINGMVSGFHVSEYVETENFSQSGESPFVYNEDAANFTESMDHSQPHSNTIITRLVVRIN